MKQVFAGSSRFASEDELTDWLREACACRGSQLIGDDAALLPRSANWAVTMDTQIEGVHFLPELDPRSIARRILAVNLSDLAAVGARPAYAFLALSTPQGFDHRTFFTAFIETCDQFDLELAGGDLSSQPRLTAALTLLGDKATGRRWLQRGTATVGESIWVGGTVGEAALGFRLLQRKAGSVRHGTDATSLGLDLPPHLATAAKRAIGRQLLPKPQIALGAWLGGCPAGAAIDISDGLSRDLRRLCSASRVGAEIALEDVPLSQHLKPLAELLACRWQDLVLNGGEDYVLLFTLPPEIRPPKRFSCCKIGTIRRKDITLSQRGKIEALDIGGWDHISG